MNTFKYFAYLFFVSLILTISAVWIYHSCFRTTIVYIRTADVVNKYSGMKEAKDQYQQKLAMWQSNIDTLENDYRRATLQYETGKNSLSSGEKNAQQQNLLKQEASIRSYVEKIEEQAKEEDAKMTEMVINQINQFIEEYSKRRGYDIVIGTNMSGTLLYGDKKLDVTEELLVELNNYYLDKK